MHATTGSMAQWGVARRERFFLWRMPSSEKAELGRRRYRVVLWRTSGMLSCRGRHCAAHLTEDTAAFLILHVLVCLVATLVADMAVVRTLPLIVFIRRRYVWCWSGCRVLASLSWLPRFLVLGVPVPCIGVHVNYNRIAQTQCLTQEAREDPASVC